MASGRPVSPNSRLAVIRETAQVVYTNLPSTEASGHSAAPVKPFSNVFCACNGLLVGKSCVQRSSRSKRGLVNHAQRLSSTHDRRTARRAMAPRPTTFLGNGEGGDEPVPVTAVDRLHELDDLAGVRMGDPLEAKCGRMERNAERRRLVLVGHRRLDGLRSADDDDPVAIAQELVERLSSRSPAVSPECGSSARAPSRWHALPVRQTKPTGDDDGLRRRDVQQAPEPRAGG